MTNAAEQISVSIVEDRLVISIGIGLLAFAVQGNEGSWPADWAVVDVEAFATEIAQVLVQEEEDGTTPVHEMLDRAADTLLESGGESVGQRSVEKGLALARKAMGE